MALKAQSLNDEMSMQGSFFDRAPCIQKKCSIVCFIASLIREVEKQWKGGWIP